MTLPVTEHTLKTARHTTGYLACGDESGPLLVFCHGWLASRLTRHPDDQLTASLGVRLITVDRAGIGRSDPDPTKTLLSAAADLQAVATKLPAW